MYTFLPGWVMRLYHDFDKHEHVYQDLCNLACHESTIDLCYVKKLPILMDISEMFPMMWRFMPMLDLHVDVLMSRDLDSIINKRESAAVAEWIQSSHSLHVIRDHPLHVKEILGGLFGIKLG